MPKFKITPQERRQFRWDVLKIAILLVGIFALAAALKVYRPLSGDAGQAMKDGLWIGAALSAALAAGHLVHRARQASFAASIAYLWVGLSTGISVVILGNALMDTSHAVDHPVRLMKKETITYGNRIRSKMVVTSWRNSGSEETLFLSGEINEKLLEKLSIGDMVMVRTKPGRFGYEWMVGISWQNSPTSAGRMGPR